jgi:hypothetical protein
VPISATIDASVLVANAITPYRGAIDGILGQVTGDPDAVLRAGQTYRAGANSSNQAATNVTTVSSGLAQSWQGPAGSAYANASQDLAGRLAQVQSTLTRQADVMAQVAQAQSQARSGVVQAQQGLAAAGGALIAASRNVPPEVVPQLVQRAQQAGVQFQNAAVAQRDGLAGVLRQAAGALNQAAQARPAAPRRGRGNAQRPAAAPAGAQHYRLNNDTVRLNDQMRDAVGRLADEYHRRTGADLTLTDGNRTPADQAARMYYRLTHPDGVHADPLWDYRNRRAVEQIRRAYRNAVAAGKTPAEVQQAMTDVIQQQVDSRPPTYVSAHLREGGVDIRLRDMTAAQRQAFRDSVTATGEFTVHQEGNPPHWHLQLQNQNQNAPGGAPAQPAPHQAGPPPRGPQPPGPWPGGVPQAVWPPQPGPPQPGPPQPGPVRRRP